MAVQVADTLTQKNGGSFPLVDGNAVAGGYQIVDSIAARDAIVPAMKKEGMEVYVKADKTTYKLQEDGSWAAQVDGETSVFVEDPEHGDYVLLK